MPSVPDDAATDPQKYDKEGRAVLSNPEVRKAIVDAANHLDQFIEFGHELYPMPRFYREMAKRVPGLTVPQFQAAMWQASQSRGVQLHVLNEVATAPDAEKGGSIFTRDRLYHFVRLNDRNPDSLRPKDDDGAR